MNPDLDDPNNHVPPVTPEDDWEDLDDPAVSEAAAAGLPPRRPDRGIPARKDPKTPHVNHHAPKLKLHEDGGGSLSPLEPRTGAGRKHPAEPPQDEADADGKPVPEKSAKTKRKATGRAAVKAVKKIAGKTAKKTKKRAAGAAQRETTAPPSEEAPPTAPEEEPAEERIVLPPAHGHRRFRVNEIDPAREVPDRPVPKLDPKPVAVAEQLAHKDLVRSRRRHVRGERGDWGARAAGGSFRWMFYTGGGVIALVIAAVVLSQRFAKKPARGEQSFYSQIAPAEAEGGSREEELESLRKLEEGQDEARRIYAKYATAGSVDDFIGLVYRPDGNAALIAEKWKPMGVGAGWEPDEVAIWSTVEQEDFRYGVLEGVLPDFTSFKAFFRLGGEGLKLDWKATTGYGSADFAEMKKGRGDGSEIRAFLSPADFHTFALPEGDYRCFKIVSPDGDANLWGYTKVGGELDAELLALFQPSQITGEAQAQFAVVLGLEPGPDDALPSQWMIRKLVRLNWLDE